METIGHRLMRQIQALHIEPAQAQDTADRMRYIAQVVAGTRTVLASLEDYAWPDLVGSQAQMRWALRIRRKQLEKGIYELIVRSMKLPQTALLAEKLNTLFQQSSATFWINHRDDPFSALLLAV